MITVSNLEVVYTYGDWRIFIIFIGDIETSVMTKFTLTILMMMMMMMLLMMMMMAILRSCGGGYRATLIESESWLLD